MKTQFTDEQIVALNAKIARYMGYSYITEQGDECAYYHQFYYPCDLSIFDGSDHREWCSTVEKGGTMYFELCDTLLQYHKSMDWLTTVIDKLQQDGYTFNITIDNGYRCVTDFNNLTADTLLEVCYLAVTTIIAQIQDTSIVSEL